MYYNTDAKGHSIPFEAEGIVKAVQEVQAGKVSHKYSENFVERFARVRRRSLPSSMFSLAV